MRWQIELAFKRLKSLLNLDALRAKDPALARSYLLGKLIAALLIQCIADQCRAISPYGVPIRRQAQPVA
jgi:IS4 transposase